MRQTVYYYHAFVEDWKNRNLGGVAKVCKLQEMEVYCFVKNSTMFWFCIAIFTIEIFKGVRETCQFLR